MSDTNTFVTQAFPVPNEKISSNKLKENVEVTIRGKVSFSHIASQYTGASLAKRVASQQGRSHITDVPHTVLSLNDVQVLAKDPANPNLEEQYVAQRIFVSKSGENVGHSRYTIEDKSQYLPTVFAPSEDGKTHSQVVLTGELANELDVILVLRTFRNPRYVNRGIGLQRVILMEPLRYYGNTGSEALSALGIVIEGAVNPVSASSAPVIEGPEDTEHIAPQLPNTVFENGFAMPAPPAATAVPVAQVAPTAPPIQQVVAQPVVPQQVVPQPVQQVVAQPVAPVAQPVAPVAPVVAQVAPAPVPAAPGGSPFGDAPQVGAGLGDATEAELLAQLAAIQAKNSGNQSI